MRKCFSFLFLAFCFVILSTAEGVAFSECTSEDEAIEWLRQRIESNEKIDKNIISIERTEGTGIYMEMLDFTNNDPYIDHTYSQAKSHVMQDGVCDS